VKGTKREADALLVQLLHQRDTGIDAPSGRLTVADYLQQWLSTYSQPNLAPKTHIRYEQLIRIHMVPVVGNIPLTKLRPLHIHEVYKRVREKGLSARTALHCHRVLKEALQHALRWQLITRNPAEAVDPPTPERYQVPALHPEEVKRLLTISDGTPYGMLVHLAVMTGLRMGELLGLRWQDVDLDSGLISVRQTCQWLPKQGFIFRQPKTHRSARPVTVAKGTVERLRQHRVRQLEDRLAAGLGHQDSDLVFANALGEPIHPNSLRDAWAKVAAEAGLRLRFHDLRHAHASLLLQQGVHPKVVSERLGHSTVGVTLDIYSHVVPGLQAQVATQLEELLENG
jgi:integrase